MKKIVCFLYFSFLTLSLFGQETYSSSNYTNQSVIDKTSITSFFASDNFQLVMIVLLGLVLVFWAIYMYSSFQLDQDSPITKTHRPSPDRYRPGVNLRYRPVGLAALNTIPIENKKEESEKKKQKKASKSKEKK